MTYPPYELSHRRVEEEEEDRVEEDEEDRGDATSVECLLSRDWSMIYLSSECAHGRVEEEEEEEDRGNATTVECLFSTLHRGEYLLKGGVGV